MKRVLLVLLVALIAIPTFQSCKKGADDPAISLKSRKARLVGEWDLSKGTLTKNNNGTLSTETYTETAISYSGGGSVNYTEKMEIVKDGTFKHTIVQNGANEIDEGQWYFMDGNKDKKIKDKEAVAFTITKITYTPAGGNTVIGTYVGVAPDFVWRLDELKSKEIIVIYDESSNQGGATSSTTGTMTYTKK